MKSRTEPPKEGMDSLGEEIGLLAAEAAVHQIEPGTGSGDRTPLDELAQARHVDARLWPDVPGVFFPEPFLLDIPWVVGLPSAARAETDRSEDEASSGAERSLDLDDLDSIELEKTYLEPEDAEKPDAEIQFLGDELVTTQPDLVAIPGEVAAPSEPQPPPTEPEGAAAHPLQGTLSAVPPIPQEEIERFEQESTFILLEGDDVELLEAEEGPVAEEQTRSAQTAWERRDTRPEIKLKKPLEEIPAAEADKSLAVPAKEPLDALELDQEDLEEITKEPAETPIHRLSTHAPPLPMEAHRDWVEKADTREMSGIHRRLAVEEGPEVVVATGTARVLPLARPFHLRVRPEPKFTMPQPSVEDAFRTDFAGRELDPFEELALPEAVRAKTIPRARPWYEVIFDDSYFEILPANLHQQTRREARFVYDSLRLQSRSQVLDMACGFGRHSFELVKLGYQMTGVDLSQTLIDKAKVQAEQRQVPITFALGDMRDYEVESLFDAVFLLGDSFGYFDDQSNFDVLVNLCRTLKPHGRFLLDALNRDRLVSELPRVCWWRGGNCLVLEEVDFDYTWSRMVSKRTLVFDDGRPPWEQYIDIRIYSLHEIMELVENAGFHLCEVSGSPLYPGLFFGRESRRIVILAERK